MERGAGRRGGEINHDPEGREHASPGRQTLTGSIEHGGVDGLSDKRSMTGVASPTIQRKSDPAGMPAPTAVIVEDDAVPTPLQIRRQDFFATIEPAIKAAVSAELGPPWNVADCPYVAKYLGVYAGRPAAVTEQFVRRYTGSAAQNPMA